MDQQEEPGSPLPEDQALPPRGNLSMGGATIEEPEADRDSMLGATTVNGGRANWAEQNQATQPAQGRPAETNANQGGLPQQGNWAGQQAYAYQNGYAPNPYQAQPGQAGTAAWQTGSAMPQYVTPATQGYPYSPYPTYGTYPQQAWPAYATQPPQVAPATRGMTTVASQAAHPEQWQASASENGNKTDFDYSNIDSSARVAIYDDLHSAPRVIRIPGGPTHEFIERIASLTYQHSQSMGGKIPYSVIREVSENFIHAQFKEVVVSILDKGDTIRFTDQGPGIKDKDMVQLPGVTSATEAMKQYIRGVGSGLPLVKDALSFNHGTITIEDNVNTGSVVTISLAKHPTIPGTIRSDAIEREDGRRGKITDNDKLVLRALLEGPAGVSRVSRETGISVSSVHNSFERLTQTGLVTEKGKERYLTEEGVRAAREIS